MSNRPVSRRLIAALALAFAGNTTMAASPPACTAVSGPKTAALVELYTSEGCNSCPPADRWLATTFPTTAEGATVIPLAFHVDYWDRLGWKDRFATPQYTDRQYQVMQATRGRFVYTPQVVIQGKDFPGWQGSARTAGTAIAAANAKPARAQITLAVTPQPGALAVNAKVDVANAADRNGAMLYVALEDSMLVSDVKAGENSGVRLTHDHVVRVLRDAGTVDRNGAIAADLSLPLPKEAGKSTTVVAFVQNRDTGDVLQALALPLTGGACTIVR